MITEEEAKTKWCPFIRIHEQPMPGKGPNMYAYNRPGITGSMTCIASECMAWRWDEEQRPETPTIEELEKILAGPEPVIKTLPSGELIALTFGHCGLAGKP